MTADPPPWLTPRLAGDVVVAVLVVVFAWLAVLLHDSVASLGDMAVGIRDTGSAIEQSGQSTANQIRRSVGDAADAIQAVPLFGGEVGRQVRRAGEQSAGAVERETRLDGRRLVVAGEEGRTNAERTARLLGWLAFLVPTVLLLAVWLTQRGRVPSRPRTQ